MSEDKKRPYKIACVGDRFGKLKVVAYAPKVPDGRRTVIVECDCGSGKKRVRVNHLVEKNTVSCGCVRDEKFAASKQEIVNQRRQSQAVGVAP